MRLSRIAALAAAALAAAAVVGTGYALSERGGAPSREAVATLQEDGDEDGQPGAGAQAKVDLIAEQFGVSPDEVEAVRAQGIGFGAMFKLYAIARATGTDVQSLIADAALDAEGEHDFAFGELINQMTEEQRAALDAGPKNLGQLVSASHRPAHAGKPAHAGPPAE